MHALGHYIRAMLLSIYPVLPQIERSSNPRLRVSVLLQRKNGGLAAEVAGAG